MKKLGSALLAGWILLSLFAGVPFGVSAAAGGEFAYEIADGEATVTAYLGGGEVTVPAVLGGVPVTAVGESAFAGQTEMTAVILPEGVKEIGAFAFEGCTGLRSVTVPASAAFMGSGVFAGCEALTDIFCAAEAKPAGWDEEWLADCGANVYWGWGKEPKEEPVLLLGDVGGNSVVDATDYMLLKRYCLGTYALTEEQLILADVNGDGKVNSVDYMLLKRMVLGTYTPA